MIRSGKTIEIDSDEEAQANERNKKDLIVTLETQVEVSRRRAMKLIKLISDLKVG